MGSNGTAQCAWETTRKFVNSSATCVCYAPWEGTRCDIPYLSLITIFYSEVN